MIATADNDRRGVALIPLSEPTNDITLMPAGTARVALRQLAPKPYAVERVDTLPAIERFLKATGDSEIGLAVATASIPDAALISSTGSARPSATAR